MSAVRDPSSGAVRDPSPGAARGPSLETRRQSDFAAELLDRARAWIPQWSLADGERDFGRALLEVAARLSAEVAERLDRAPDKIARGFLDWLAVRGKAAQPARMPVVFKLTDRAPEAVLARPPVRLQVTAQGASVVFETEREVRVVPGRLEQIVGVDPAADAFYLPPPGLTSLDPLQPLPTQWRLKSFAAAKTTNLQLDPPLGLSRGMILEVAGAQYDVARFENDLATIEPPLAADADADTVVRKVTTFSPFEGARNRQRHVLYIGDPELLKLEAAATIDVVGAQLLSGASWTYWGKAEGSGSDEADWQPLELADEKAQKPDALVLRKPKKGEIEQRKVGETQSRWIRALVDHVDGCEPVLATDALSLRVNDPPPVPPSDPKIEVFVNSTPDTTRNFFPLGREPKLFDTLYIGCAEAFSKPRADVDVQFDLTDASFFAMSALVTSGGQGFLSAADSSGALHLFRIGPDGPLYPLRVPGRPESAGPGVAAGAKKIRPVMWEDNGLNVAVALGPEVWLWHERLGIPSPSVWRNLQSPPPGDDTSDPNVLGLAIAGNNVSRRLVALRGKRLWKRAVLGNQQWDPLPVVVGGVDLNLERIASFRTDDPDKLSDLLVGTTSDDKLYSINLTGTAVKLLDDIAFEVTPCALESPSGDRYAAAVSKGLDRLRAWPIVPNEVVPREVDLDPGDKIEDTLLDARIEGTEFAVYALAKAADGNPRVVTWLPFADGIEKLVFKTPANPATGVPTGAITLHGEFLYVPGMLGQVLALVFSGTRILLSATQGKFVSAFVTSPLTAVLAPADKVALFNGTDYLIAAVVEGPTPYGLSHYYWLDTWLIDTIPDAPGEIFRGAAKVGKRLGNEVLSLVLNDPAPPQPGDVLLIDDGAGGTLMFEVLSEAPPGKFNVKSVPDGSDLPILTDPTLPPDSVLYRTGETVQGHVVPALNLDSTNNDWDPAIVAGHDVLFPELKPQRQRAGPVLVDPGTRRPRALAFDKEWVSLPTTGTIGFVIDGVSAAWRSLLGDTSSNPTLSWEYWNGGWTKLKVADDTLNLKNSGTLKFEVPADLQPTDWAGKTNHWIRARLIGGDYGREEVTVSSTTSGGTTTQTVNRSTDGIQPPYALSVSVQYGLDDPVLPAFLITEDSGTPRDQSDANRVPGARLEIFTPLCATLKRLNEDSAPAATPCPQECECKATGQPAREPAAEEAGPVTTAGQPGQDRALYLGFDAEPSGAPVNVLLMVNREQAYERFAPLEVATLIRNRFQPLIAEDKTRALGESGLLSLAFPVKPTRNELFGRSLAWVRLTPAKADATTPWIPKLRGAYLNAVWARAAETLTRELLGSSEGMPKLRLQLARPPVLQGTLELRVKEPLGEEERRALVEGNPNRVLSDVPNLPGHWVLWEQKPDTDDCGPDERVYMLHEETGILRFGDGRHGAIPPVGRDSIVAFTYQRTEPPAAGAADVPANSVPARAALSLVTPVEGAEAVFAADAAAGGAPPEPTERVQRFGSARLRHRDRAVTARDFEDLALQRFVEIAQARCFARGGRLRMVVVMRGAQLQPGAALKRELRRALLESAPSWLSAPGALRIDGPAVRRMRVALRLSVASLDHAGDVSETAAQRIRSLLDPATGGAAGLGWPLGAAPSAEDIAAALLDVPRLQAISDIELREAQPDGADLAWRGAVKPAELVVLADDGVRIAFDPVTGAP